MHQKLHSVSLKELHVINRRNFHLGLTLAYRWKLVFLVSPISLSPHCASESSMEEYILVVLLQLILQPIYVRLSYGTHVYIIYIYYTCLVPRLCIFLDCSHGNGYVQTRIPRDACTTSLPIRQYFTILKLYQFTTSWWHHTWRIVYKIPTFSGRCPTLMNLENHVVPHPVILLAHQPPVCSFSLISEPSWLFISSLHIVDI